MEKELVEEIAVVTDIVGGYAHLEKKSASSCGNCSNSAGCGSIKILGLKQNSRLKLLNVQQLRVGDSVLIGMRPYDLVSVSFVMYLLPLFSLFIFAIIGKAFGGEIISIVSGLIGFFLGFVAVKAFFKRSRVEQYFEPSVIKKLETN